MNKKLLLYFLIIFSFIFCNMSFNKIVKDTYNSSEIRVKLTFHNEINIIVKNNIKISELDTDNEIKTGKKLNIIKKDNKVFLNDNILDKNLKIISKNNSYIIINNKKYLGYLKILINDDDFTIINVIPLETYLISVLTSEIPLSFNIEAIKAQTIVARTFAILNMNKYSYKREYDVDDTVSYQVYKGYNFKLKNEYLKKINEAINLTKGLIVVYNNKPIIAYFHANSGGLTRSGFDYFGKNSDYPYLISHSDPFSIFLPGSVWVYSIKIDDFKKYLNAAEEINIEDFNYNENGFVDEIKINNSFYSTKTIRQKIGYSLIKSERFKVQFDNAENKIIFYGIGYGHGVGLSQWGAHGMAQSGFNYKEIIKFYYPDTELKIYLNDINK